MRDHKIHKLYHHNAEDLEIAHLYSFIWMGVPLLRYIGYFSNTAQIQDGYNSKLLSLYKIVLLISTRKRPNVYNNYPDPD